MKRNFLTFALALISTMVLGQSGHLMQGVGAVNMSMGGAATGKAMGINGALLWNPASISQYNGTKIGLDVGGMFSNVTLSSSMPMMNPDGTPVIGPDGNPIMLSGSVDSDKGVSPLPSASVVWGKADSKHTFGVSIFGVSGFGADFAEDTNNPGYMDGSPNPNYDPNKPYSPISGPQSAGGFGHIESNYMLLQAGFTWAYQITENLSIGIQPTINYQSLEISPNPIVMPSQTAGYSKSETASAIGFGGQIGVYYDSKKGFTAGASYKSKQYMADFSFEGNYLDGTSAPTTDFTMNFPAIVSVGLGYSTANGMLDFAIDYRRVFYSSTEGFEDYGWAMMDDGQGGQMPNGTVNGFGWSDMDIISVGVQINIIEKLPIRLGYTYNSNPIDEEMIMYSLSAPGIVQNAFQLGLGYEISEKFTVNGLFHYGMSSGETTGQMLNPTLISPVEVETPMGPMGGPLGKVPGSEISVDMSTMLITIGILYTL